MKTERIVQILYYALILVIFVGLINNNDKPLIPVNIKNTLLIVIVVLLFGFIAYYYQQKGKTKGDK